MDKSRYEPSIHKDQVVALKKDGYTDAEIAELLGITRITLRKWKKDNPDLKEALDEIESNYRAFSYPDFVHAVSLKELGLPDTMIAEQMEISLHRLDMWKEKNAGFKKALIAATKKRRDFQVYNVEEKLIQSALGFEYEEQEVIANLKKDGSEKDFRKKIIKKFRAPSVSAQELFLCNNANDRYSKNQNITLSDNTEYDKQREKISRLFEEVKKQKI